MLNARRGCLHDAAADGQGQGGGGRMKHERMQGESWRITNEVQRMTAVLAQGASDV